MEYIGKNAEVISYLTGNRTLLDATISKFDIHLAEHTLQIDIYFHLCRRAKVDLKVMLTFKDVVEYCFYHKSNYAFYDVEDLKFFEIEGKFYFSGDPYHTEGVSENDNDFVMSNELEAYLF
jgi:hypothetical protein